MTWCSCTMRRLRSAARRSHAAVVRHLCTTSSVNTYAQGAGLYTVEVLYCEIHPKETHGDTGRECQGYEVLRTHLPPHRCSSAQAPLQGSRGTNIGSGAANKAGARAWTRSVATRHGGSKEITLPRASHREWTEPVQPTQALLSGRAAQRPVAAWKPCAGPRGTSRTPVCCEGLKGRPAPASAPPLTDLPSALPTTVRV